MLKFIYGTTNKEKIKQVKDYIEYKNIDCKILSLEDIKFNEKIDENGKTFEENSLIKAKAIKEFCNKNNIYEDIITDDAGLCIDSLNGEPGIYSARYAGESATQIEKISKVLDNMNKAKDKKRTAEFICVLTLLEKNEKVKQVRGITNGTISSNIGPLGKLTYGPIFIPKGKNKCLNELSEDELGETHRERALNEILKYLEEEGKI